MSIERGEPPQEPQEQQEPEFEYKSEHAARIEKAVLGAVEYQESEEGWSENIKEDLTSSLRKLFDLAILQKGDIPRDLTLQDLNEIVGSRSKQPKRHSYQIVDEKMRKKYGVKFSYKTPVRNTLGLLHTGYDSVEDLQNLSR